MRASNSIIVFPALSRARACLSSLLSWIKFLPWLIVQWFSLKSYTNLKTCRYLCAENKKIIKLLDSFYSHNILFHLKSKLLARKNAPFLLFRLYLLPIKPAKLLHLYQYRVQLPAVLSCWCYKEIQNWLLLKNVWPIIRDCINN